jgi:hypothetical protein
LGVLDPPHLQGEKCAAKWKRLGIPTLTDHRLNWKPTRDNDDQINGTDTPQREMEEREVYLV